MRYYLDTNTLIFVLGNDKDELSLQTLDVLEDYSNSFYLSTVVIRELILLYKEGKLKHLKYKTYKEIFDAIGSTGIKITPIQEKHLYTYAELEPALNHKDPNDHVIIAQSISDKIPIISCDTKFKLYEKQGLELVFNRRR